MYSTEYPDACAKMARISRDLHQGLGSGTEQQVVKQTLIAECKRRQLLRYGEDHMDVGHRQQA